jgi:TetR/AcrR family tetracycline transcriptional repressor
MSRPSKRVGRPRADEPGLSRERILAAALALVDEHGLAALTMRRLAERLGADPMSLYHHLPNKAAIVSGLVRAVFAEMRLPEPGAGEWPEQVRAWAGAYRDLAVAHPNLVLQIVTDAAAASEAAVLIGEPLHAALEAAGLPPAAVSHAAGLVVDFVHGYVLAEAGGETDDDSLIDLLDRYPPDRFPVQRRAHAAARAQPGAAFAAGLDIVIAGVRALAAAE